MLTPPTMVSVGMGIGNGPISLGADTKVTRFFAAVIKISFTFSRCELAQPIKKVTLHSFRNPPTLGKRVNLYSSWFNTNSTRSLSCDWTIAIINDWGIF